MIAAILSSLNYGRWPKRSLCMCLVLVRYCDKLVERLQENQNLADKERIESAIKQALDALNLVNEGHEYDKDNPDDPIRKAEENIKQFFEKHELIEPPRQGVPEGKLATVTKMIREITDTTTSARYPVKVNVCDFSAGTVDPVTRTLEYRFTGNHHTLDDVLYLVGLRCSSLQMEHPYIYCRSVQAHGITQEGSKFKKIEPSRSLMGLPPSSGENRVVGIYLIAAPREFFLLVRGIPFGGEENDKDRFYIVHKFGEVTTKVITQHEANPKPITFYHISEASWSYTCDMKTKSTITWKDHRAKKQLTPYKGEWFACTS